MSSSSTAVAGNWASMSSSVDTSVTGLPPVLLYTCIARVSIVSSAPSNIAGSCGAAAISDNHVSDPGDTVGSRRAATFGFRSKEERSGTCTSGVLLQQAAGCTPPCAACSTFGHVSSTAGSVRVVAVGVRANPSLNYYFAHSWLVAPRAASSGLFRSVSPGVTPLTSQLRTDTSTSRSCSTASESTYDGMCRSRACAGSSFRIRSATLAEVTSALSTSPAGSSRRADVASSYVASSACSASHWASSCGYTCCPCICCKACRTWDEEHR